MPRTSSHSSPSIEERDQFLHPTSIVGVLGERSLQPQLLAAGFPVKEEEQDNREAQRYGTAMRESPAHCSEGYAAVDRMADDGIGAAPDERRAALGVRKRAQVSSTQAERSC